MALIKCPECGGEVSEQAASCPRCGHPVKRQNTMFCTRCAKEIDKEAVICPACGVPTKNFQNQQQAQPPINVNVSNINTNTNFNTDKNTNYYGRGGQKNKWVALILCFFLGFVGAHKFYEGKFIMGILYIFTGGLFVIGIILDFIAILLKPNPYYV
ncbi:MAG: TM2 domain-containing protein [Oscillospiraceae bacterium]|nr:TM2 domain-containing protein [Oscillospiraceae bacterium]